MLVKKLFFFLEMPVLLGCSETFTGNLKANFCALQGFVCLERLLTHWVELLLQFSDLFCLLSVLSGEASSFEQVFGESQVQCKCAMPDKTCQALKVAWLNSFACRMVPCLTSVYRR
jgi:hypothetical protein